MYIIATIGYITVCCGHNVKVLEMKVIEDDKEEKKLHNVTLISCVHFLMQKSTGTGTLGSARMCSNRKCRDANIMHFP